MTPNNYLQNIVGKVIEIHLPYKAILSFQSNGKAERALLRADKIIVNGQNVPMGESIVNYVQIGSMLKFGCHGFDETGQDRCGYFVTVARRQEPDGVNSTGTKNSTEILGIYNASGVIVEVSQRQGVIQYTDADDRDHNVLFFGSKLYLFGKRTSSKQNINLTLAMDDKVQFDAVPCEQTENDSHCPWFATLVWKGKKPAIEYDNPVLPTFEPKNLSSELKQLTSNPKSLFVRAKGQILQILNEEFGVALAAVKLNNWESVLFHRSACFLFKLNLASHDLTKIFQEGDKVSFIAARASRQYITQWVASQVTLDISKDLDYEYEVQLDPSHTL